MAQRVELTNVRTVVLDIEGTTSAISFVYDVLFPYARRRLAAFLDEHWETAAVVSAREQIARDAGAPVADDLATLVAHVLALMDRDAKLTGLKQLQGLIWERGYAAGELRSHFFDDVPRAIERWRAAGIEVAVYSSGSTAAQRAFFAHSAHGDLSRELRGFFDTTVGAKRERASYERISQLLERVTGELAFLSDVVEELDAAADAGWKTVLVVRPGNRPANGQRHARIESFDDLSLL